METHYTNSMKFVNQMELGQLLERIEKYAGKYELSFQFWGEGSNNVFIEKDGVELISFGGEDTPKKSCSGHWNIWIE